MSADAGPAPAGGGPVDVHAHCVPAAALATLRREGGRFGVELLERDRVPAARIAGRVVTGPLRPELVDVERRLAAMDACGVRLQLLSSFVDLLAYALDARAGARYARMFNEALAATAARHPQRLAALATVPLQAPQRAASELRHAVQRLGMVGVEIATTVDGTELDDAGLAPFWHAAEELACLVLVHPHDPLAGRGVTRHFLGNLVGNPAETTVAVAHLVLGGVLERVPALRLCVVHGGGFLPYQAGRLDRGWRSGPPAAAAHLSVPPSRWLRRLYYDTIVHAPQALAYLIDFAGAEQVLLGSDYPFEMGEPDPVGAVRALPGLDPAARALILEGNARRLLGAVRR
jgi:aminocarboxymuconate-semialdehyde decarboxylase